MAEIFQELWCTKCHVFMGFHIENGFNGVIKVICGACNHCHQRMVKEGRIVEEGRFNGLPVMDIVVMKSQCYAESRISTMQKAQEETRKIRDGYPGSEDELGRPMTTEEKERAAFLNELWADYHGGKQ